MGSSGGIMSPIVARAYDEALAKADHIQRLEDIAATQDLSEDLRASTLNLSIAFTVFAAVFVGLRFLARCRISVRFGADDWLMVVSLVLLIGNLVMNIELVKMGCGLHNGALTLPQLQKIDETMVAAEILYVTAVNMYKISLLFLYFRIFPIRNIRRGGYVCGGVSTAWNAACIFAATFQCSPREKIWTPWLEGACINLFLTQLCISVPTILCDVAILCLPIPHVWRLKTNLTQRIFLMGIFLLGSYVVFTSIYRFYIYLSYRADDVPYTIAPGLAWNVIEISSGIVSACLPTLGPLVQTVFTSLSATSRGGSSGPLGGGSSSAHKQSNHIVTIGGSGAEEHHRQSNKWRRLHGSQEDRKYGIYDDEPDHLVPPKYRGEMTVTVSHSRNDGSADASSNDEIPLTGICRNREVEWKEERVQPVG